MIAPDPVSLASDNTPLFPATCTVVGTVSPIHLYLRPHGNHHPQFKSDGLENSKLQFQIVAPAFLPDFEADFNLGLERIETFQEKIIADRPGAVADGIVVVYNETQDGPQKALVFSWPLFQKRVCKRTFYTHCYPG
jgi:hypothetical protein